MSDLISVIIPTYNRVHYLSETLNRVLRQTYTNFEVIVCDDGSTDDTQNLVKSFSEKDSRVKYIYCGKNGRPAIPRNIGIREAKGEWLAFVDDDDWWNITKLEAQLYSLKKYNVLACCTNAYKRIGAVTGKGNTGERYFEGGHTRLYAFRDLLPYNPVICSSMIVHRSIIERCVGFPESVKLRAIEDYALWMRVASITNILYLVNPLLEYLIISSTSIRDNKLTLNQQKKLVEDDYRQWLSGQDIKIKLYVYEERLLRAILDSKMTTIAKKVRRKIRNNG